MITFNEFLFRKQGQDHPAYQYLQQYLNDPQAANNPNNPSRVQLWRLLNQNGPIQTSRGQYQAMPNRLGQPAHYIAMR